MTYLENVILNGTKAERKKVSEAVHKLVESSYDVVASNGVDCLDELEEALEALDDLL